MPSSPLSAFAYHFTFSNLLCALPNEQNTQGGRGDLGLSAPITSPCRARKQSESVAEPSLPLVPPSPQQESDSRFRRFPSVEFQLEPYAKAGTDDVGGSMHPLWSGGTVPF